MNNSQRSGNEIIVQTPVHTALICASKHKVHLTSNTICQLKNVECSQTQTQQYVLMLKLCTSYLWEQLDNMYANQILTQNHHMCNSSISKPPGAHIWAHGCCGNLPDRNTNHLILPILKKRVFNFCKSETCNQLSTQQAAQNLMWQHCVYSRSVSVDSTFVC